MMKTQAIIREVAKSSIKTEDILKKKKEKFVVQKITSYNSYLKV